MLILNPWHLEAYKCRKMYKHLKTSLSVRSKHSWELNEIIQLARTVASMCWKRSIKLSDIMITQQLDGICRTSSYRQVELENSSWRSTAFQDEPYCWLLEASLQLWRIRSTPTMLFLHDGQVCGFACPQAPSVHYLGQPPTPRDLPWIGNSRSCWHDSVFSGDHALVLWAIPSLIDLQILGIPVATAGQLVLRMKLVFCVAWHPC